MRVTLGSPGIFGLFAICVGCSVSHVTAGDGEPADPDLVHAFGFDEGDGDVTVDSLSAVTLARVGASWDAAGKRGSAARFDGVDDYFELDAPGATLDFGSGDFTLTAWIKSERFSLATGNHLLVMGRGIGAPPQPGYRMYFQWTDFHSHNLSGDIADGSAQNGFSPVHQQFFAERDGQWILVAMTRRGSELALFVDGERYNSSVNPVGDIDADGELNDRFRIGALPYQALWPFDGWIDEVRVYTRALDDGELAQLLAQE